MHSPSSESAKGAWQTQDICCPKSGCLGISAKWNSFCTIKEFTEALLNTLEAAALVAVARGEALADGGGGKEAGDEDVSSRGGLCLGGVGGELRRVGVVEGVLLDGQGEAKSRNGEEQKEAHHTGSSPQDL